MLYILCIHYIDFLLFIYSKCEVQFINHYLQLSGMLLGVAHLLIPNDVANPILRDIIFNMMSSLIPSQGGQREG